MYTRQVRGLSVRHLLSAAAHVNMGAHVTEHSSIEIPIIIIIQYSV